MAAAKQPAAATAAMPPTTPNDTAQPFRASTPARHVARAEYAARAVKTMPSTTAPDASRGICDESRTVIAKRMYAIDPTRAMTRMMTPGEIRGRDLGRDGVVAGSPRDWLTTEAYPKVR
jgi:hypothetical protein